MWVQFFPQRILDVLVLKLVWFSASSFNLVVPELLGELRAMTRERDEWKKRCDTLEEQLSHCRPQLENIDPVNTEEV